MTKTVPNKDAAVIWQEVPEGVPEPAIVITPYCDIIELNQEGRHIHINYETVKELCKHLKTLTLNFYNS